MARRSTFDPQLLRDGLGDHSQKSQFDWDVVRDPVFGVASDALALAGAPVVDDEHHGVSNFGDQIYGGYLEDIGNSFLSTGGKLVASDFLVYQYGGWTTTIARLYAVYWDGTNWIPNTLLAESDPIVFFGSGSIYFHHIFSGANQINLIAGTNYALVFNYTGPSGALAYLFNSTGYAGHNTAQRPTPAGGWYGTSYVFDFAVYIAGTDQATIALSPSRTAPDAISTSESLIRILPVIRSNTDSISTSESANLALPLSRIGSEAISTTEARTRILSAIRVCSDNPLLAEVVARSLSLSRATVDHPFTAEAISRLIGLLRTAVDNPVVSESLIRTAIRIKTAIDNPTTVESAVRLLTLLRTTTDNPFTSEFSTALKIKLGLAFDSLTVAESLAEIGSFKRTIGDAVNTADLVARILPSIRLATDALLAAHSLLRSIGSLRNGSDAINTAEVLARVLGGKRNGADSLITSDIVFNAGTNFKMIFDSMAVVEGMSSGAAKPRSTVDTLLRSDVVLRNLLASCTAADLLLISEYARFPFYQALASDHLTTLDVGFWNLPQVYKILVALELAQVIEIKSTPDELTQINIEII